MNRLKPLIGLPFIALFFALSGTTMSSCTKNTADTLYITHDSAVFVHDTSTVADTTYSLNSGLVAYFNFNGGNLNDSSGYNNNIVFNNAIPTADRNGIPDNAYLFDGSTSYMTVANSPSLNPDNITMYAIFKVNGYYAGLSHGNFIFVKDWDQAYGTYLMLYSDFVNPTAPPDTAHEYFASAYGDNPGLVGNASVANSNMFVRTGSWYKMAYTYDGMVANLYLNGTLISSQAFYKIPFNPNANDLYIGRSSDPSGIYPMWFNGAIDEIRIYDRALTSKEITSLTNLP